MFLISKFKGLKWRNIMYHAQCRESIYIPNDKAIYTKFQLSFLSRSIMEILDKFR